MDAIDKERGEIINRVFLNLWFAKRMVCMRVNFHDNAGKHENDENEEDKLENYKQGVEWTKCWRTETFSIPTVFLSTKANTDTNGKGNQGETSRREPWSAN